MTDFNKECELLKGWIAYRVEEYANYLQYNKGVIFNILGMPKISPSEVMRFFAEQGILFVNSDEPTVEPNIMTFEEYKEFLNSHEI